MRELLQPKVAYYYETWKLKKPRKTRKNPEKPGKTQKNPELCEGRNFLEFLKEFWISPKAQIPPKA